MYVSTRAGVKHMLFSMKPGWCTADLRDFLSLSPRRFVREVRELMGVLDRNIYIIRKIYIIMYTRPKYIVIGQSYMKP